MYKIDLERIKTKQWYRQGAMSIPWFIHLPYLGASVMVGEEIVTYEGKNNVGYLDKEYELEQVKKVIELEKKEEYIQEKRNLWREKSQETINRLEKSNFEELEDSEIVELSQKIGTDLLEEWEICSCIDAFDPWGEEIVEKELERFGVKLKEEELIAITSSPEPNLLQREKIDRFSLIKKGIFEKEIREHTKNYFYMLNSWAEARELNEAYFLSIAKDPDLEKEVKSMENTLRKIKETNEKLKKILPNELYKVLNLFSQLSAWREERKSYVLLVNHYLYKLLKEISKRSKADIRLLEFAVEDEIKSLSFSKEYLHELEERRKISVYNREFGWVYGEKALEIIEAIEEGFERKEIRGNIACKGIAKGRVKIIKVPEDFEKFNKGDVLVTIMTRPEHVPLMKKAVAIVTDEGGITCHAAIVSRELGIPCIVGTQVATRALKDGELVEVNANKGVVTRCDDPVGASVSPSERTQVRHSSHRVSEEIMKEELLKLIKNSEWYKQALSTRAYFIFLPCRGAAHQLETDISIWTIKDMKNLEWVSPKKRFNEKARELIELQKKDSKTIDRIMNECNEKGKIFEEFYIQNLRKDFSKMDIKEISKLLRKMEDLRYDYWIKAYLCDDFDPEGEEILREEIKKEGLKLSDEDISTLFRTNEINFMQKERLAILMIIQKLNKKEINLEEAKELLEKHSEEFFYVDNSWESVKILTAEDFVCRLKEYSESEVEEQLKDLTTDWDLEHEKIRKKQDISDKMMAVFYLYRNLFIIRDKRKRHVLLANHVYDQLFRRVSEIFSIPIEELNVILCEEITEEVTAEELKEKIEQRKKYFVEVYKNEKTHLFSGEEGREIFEAVHRTFSYEGDVLRGTGVSRGKTKGVVRVIRGESHFSKFNEGEVLVAPMTRPEYVPLMKKALAVVTDEGGVTCHAAIVSRELGIPCIVGTQVATSKLHDGDYIEVDANKGIVRKLK